MGDREADRGMATAPARLVVVGDGAEAGAVDAAHRGVGGVAELHDDVFVGFDERVTVHADRRGLCGLTGSERDGAACGCVVGRGDWPDSPPRRARTRSSTAP